MRPSIEALRKPQQREANERRGMIRRMLLAGSEGALSTIAGGADAEGNLDRETGVETFGVAGVRSHPAVRPEVIAVRVGARGAHTVIIATRDRGMEAAGELDADEVAIETSKTFVVIKANGDVLIGRPDGTFERICTESHVHSGGVLTNGGGTVTGTSGKAIVNPATAPGEAGLGGRGLAAVAKAETETGL